MREDGILLLARLPGTDIIDIHVNNLAAIY